ncbi:MAG TPA: hypothetical protein VN625_01400 [Desulfuromonadaceae bacterium]|nr:hypothetical protein [Desulfuromonadaceae bacterium]
MKNIWRTGLIFSAINFLTLVVHWLFQFIVSPQLGGSEGEYGLIQFTIAFVMFLQIPLQIATQAVTHYVARFHFSGEDDRLHGLLAGCRKFLFHVTIGGSIVAVILVQPLGGYFGIPRTSLTLVALFVVLGGLWSSYFSVICQGLGWFKRLALIGLLGAVIRLLFGGVTTHFWPRAEWAVTASVVMLLANVVLLFWKDQFPRPTEKPVSPWTPEFTQFLIVSTAWAIGTNCFNQGDLLVAKKFFSKADMDAYGSAGLFARALPTAVAPLLIILFTHRSSQEHHGNPLLEQLKLIGLYTVGLVSGAVCLYALRGFCLQLLHRHTPEAAAMIGPLAVTMVFVGLLQALGTWSLASRWVKISLLYGALGVAYWLAMLLGGHSPAELLRVMPVAAGIAFAAVFLVWLIAMRLHKISARE